MERFVRSKSTADPGLDSVPVYFSHGLSDGGSIQGREGRPYSKRYGSFFAHSRLPLAMRTAGKKEIVFQLHVSVIPSRGPL
jgi:hypothetical protein